MKMDGVAVVVSFAILFGICHIARAGTWQALYRKPLLATFGQTNTSYTLSAIIAFQSEMSIFIIFFSSLWAIVCCNPNYIQIQCGIRWPSTEEQLELEGWGEIGGKTKFKIGLTKTTSVRCLA